MRSEGVLGVGCWLLEAALGAERWVLGAGPSPFAVIEEGWGSGAWGASTGHEARASGHLARFATQATILQHPAPNSQHLAQHPAPRLIVVEDADELGRIAARRVAREIRRDRRAVLALPTGNTPLAMYRWLARLYEEGAVDFAEVRTFNLDEFYGIATKDPASFATYMRRELFDRVNLRAENVHLLDSEARDVVAECRRYEEEIARADGLDLAILGIGQNGHIGFNEPGSPFDSQTRLVRLAGRTIADSRLFFADPSQAPRLALTMGITTIMRARRILLLAAGRKKATIVARSLLGAVTPAVPASILQCHPRVTVIVDREAAAGLAWARFGR